MPQEKYTISDMFGETGGTSLASILAADTGKVYSLDNFFAPTEKIEDRTWLEESWGVLEQFLRGATSEATLGLAKHIIGEEAPITFAEKISRGLGSFTGFLLTPLKIGKIGAKIGLKALGLAGAKKGVKSVARYALQHAGTLGIASAVSDITEPQTLAARFTSGATMGAIFGAAGLGKIEKYPALSLILRQFGGRALMKMAGMYPSEYFEQENLPHAIFQEALNTYFFSRGMTPKQLWTGKVPKVELARMRAIDEQRIQLNKELAVEDRLKFGAEYKARGLPSILEAIQAYGKEFIDPEVVQMAGATKNFFFDTKTGRLIPEQIWQKTITAPEQMKFEVSRAGEISLVEVGTGVNKKAVKKFEATARQGIKVIKMFPGKKLPDELQLAVNEKVIELFPQLIRGEREMGIEPFFRAAGVKLVKGKATYGDLFDIQKMIDTVAKAPYGMELSVLLKGFKERHELPPDVMELKVKEKEMQQFVKDTQDYLLKQRQSDMSAAKKKGGAVLTRLMNPGYWKLWWDVRKWAGWAERRTGLPLKGVVEKLDTFEGVVRQRLYEYMKPFGKFKGFSKEDFAAVENYYTRMYAHYKDPKVKLIPKESLKPIIQEYITSLDTHTSMLRPLVQLIRFRGFEKSFYESKGDFKKTLPIYQNQKDMKGLLLRGLSISRERGDKGLFEWFGTEAKNLGAVEAGNYLPGIITGSHNVKQHMEWARFINSLSKSHLKSRTDTFRVESTEGVRKLFADQFYESPMNVRIYNYTRQVLNSMYLERPLNALNELVRDFKPYFEGAKGRAGFKKEMSMEDFMLLYAHRIRGLPVKPGGLAKAARVVQSLFFRALVVKPYLWLRNVFQRIVTMPHKEIMLDKEYWKKKYRFKRMPEEIKKRFNEEVSQFESFERDWLLYEETALMKEWKFGGWWIRMAEKVGRIYPLSDLSNRQSVFSKVFHRSKNFIEAYQRGEIPFKELRARLGIDKVDEPLERLKWLDLINKGEVDNASFRIGKWMSHNSQWIYRRTGKSLYEMTAEGESFTNLLTWSKGISQRLYGIKNNLYEGFERGGVKDPMFQAAGKEAIGLMLAGGIASEILMHVSVGHGKKYRDYAFDAPIWEIGGVSFGLIKDFTERMGELVTAIDATPQERQRAWEDMLKYVDNIFIRQLIPFSKQMLAAIESITGRAYMQPFYNYITKKGYTKVDRTFLEGLSHALLAIDPNKGADLRKHTGVLKHKWYDRMVKEKNPALKAFFKSMYERYDYLSNLYQRYEPIEIYKFLDAREARAFEKKFDEDVYYESLYGMERKGVISERKAKMGY